MHLFNIVYCVILVDRDMLAYNMQSDETTVFADGKEKQSRSPVLYVPCL